MAKKNITNSATNRILGSLDLIQPQNRSKIQKPSIAIAFIFSLTTSTLSIVFGYPIYLILIAVGLLVPTVILHELLHFVFQWLFSHQKPRLGFKYPFPYSALSPNARISRNQGIFCAASPFLIISICLVLAAFFFNLNTKVILLSLAFIHIISCIGDFYFINWIRKFPSNSKLSVVGLVSILYGR